MSVEHRNNKWVSRIQIDGKRIYLGTFKLKKDAIEAYNVAKAVDKADKQFNKAIQEADEAIYQGHELLEKVSIWTKMRSLFR